MTYTCSYTYRPNKIKTYRQYLRFLQNHRFEPQTRVEPVYIGCINLVTTYTCNNCIKIQIPNAKFASVPHTTKQ